MTKILGQTIVLSTISHSNISFYSYNRNSINPFAEVYLKFFSLSRPRKYHTQKRTHIEFTHQSFTATRSSSLYFRHTSQDL